MWRFREALPAEEPVSLGEGGTPLLQSRLHPGLWIKDEGANPAGSFLARSVSAAVSVARGQGLTEAFYDGPDADVPAMYAAAAGIVLRVPRFGARPWAERVRLAGYGIDESGSARPLEIPKDRTLGLELAEQAGDAEYILVPKRIGASALREAFAGRLPGPRWVEWDEPGEVDDVVRLARADGLLLSRDGAGGVRRYEQLLREASIRPGSKVVLINPEAAWRDQDRIAEVLGVRQRQTLPVSMPVGGIITPI